MTSIPAPTSPHAVAGAAQGLSTGRLYVLLGVTVLFAVLLYYFVGLDAGMTSVFGETTVVHEWVHDSRHFLGFPCH